MFIGELGCTYWFYLLSSIYLSLLLLAPTNERTNENVFF